MNPFYRFVWLTYRLWFTVYHRYRVCNAERVPTTGPALLACNHASFYDPPLIGSSLPREIGYLGRESLFKNRLINWGLRNLNVIPVDRDGGGAAGLKRVLDTLAQGRAVVLFPEGTRTRDGHLQPVRAGIGLAVLKTDAPVLPMRVFGTYESWNRQHRLPRPWQIVVKYGHPLDFDALRAEAKTCSKTRLKAIYQQIANEIMAAIAALQPCVDKAEFP